MNEVKLLSYVKKWWIPIALLSLVLCYLFNQYIEKKQTYSASAIIEYTNPEVSGGLTPSGDKIDVSQIGASNVIADAVRELDLGVSIDFVRSCLKIEPIVSDEELTRMTALLEKGEEYQYFAPSYLVSFKVGSAYNEEFARRTLEAIFRSYMNFYAEKYIDVTVTPNNVGNTANESFDYIESVELIQNSLDDIIDFLSVRADAYPYFYCSTNGYSFGNLHDLYIELRELQVYKLTSKILNERVARDRETLIKKYQYWLDSAENDSIAYQEKLDELTALIAQYSDKSIETFNYSQQTADENGASVTNFVYDGNFQRKTMYDMLMDDYVNVSINLEMCKKDIEHYAERLAVFESGGAMDSPENNAAVEERIASITQTSNDLYEMLLEMIAEFNEYNSTRSVALQSTIDVTTGVNTKLYTMVALVFFVIIGVIGTVAIARFGEMYRYYRFVDAKTNVPNRLSCDNEIERLSAKPLPDDVCCVAIALDSLSGVNTREGRRLGDIMLKNFGMMLNYCGSKFGFVGYNGGPNFMCIFEKCHLDKAASFESMLRNAVENYNRRYPENPVNIRMAVCESGREGVFDIRDLLKRSMSALYAKKDEAAAAGEKTDEK